MKQIRNIYHAIILGLLVGMTSCTDIDDLSDWNVKQYPTTITAGDVTEVNAQTAYISYGTDNGNTSRDYHSYSLAEVRLYVSNDTVFEQYSSKYNVSSSSYPRYNEWKVEGLEPNTTYYYCEYVSDYAGQVVRSEWKKFTTPQEAEVDCAWHGKNDVTYMFDITIEKFKGTPKEIGMLYGTSYNLTMSNYGLKYTYTTTPSNPDGISPWYLYFNIQRSDFDYNNYSWFYYRAYLKDENNNYFFSDVKTAYP
jgi:hypothetical protein